MIRVSAALFILLAWFASSCFAQVQYAVVVLDGQGTQIDVARNNTGSLSLNLATTARTVLIFGGSVAPNNVRLFDTTRDIGSVSLSGGPGAGLSLNVVIGSSFSSGSDAGTAAAQNCAGVDMSGVLNANSTFSGRVGGNLTGAIRGARQLYRFDVDGTITASGSVRAGAPGNGGFAIVQAGSMAAGSSVTLDSGTLFRLQTAGDMAGNISVGNPAATPPTSGDITSVVVGGNITSTATISVTATPTAAAPSGTLGSLFITGSINLPVTGNPRIYARNGMRSISAASITGVISTLSNGTADVGSGTLDSVTTRIGSFQGLLSTQGLATGSGTSISIAGDLGGPAASGRILIRDSAVANRPIVIGGQIRVGSILSFGNSLPANLTIGGGSAGPGLAGQILANAGNVGGTWTGNIRVGGPGPSGTDLYFPPSSRSYTNTTASLGGGSVGLVPYNLHDSSCNPPQLAALPPTRIPPSNPPADTRIFLASNFSHSAAPNREITLEWYGPVYAAAGTPPVSIFRADENGNPAITDQAGAYSYT